eukprot:scaffold34941_cov167-Amphora_coffeaeformis.AAC.3
MSRDWHRSSFGAPMTSLLSFPFMVLIYASVPYKKSYSWRNCSSYLLLNNSLNAREDERARLRTLGEAFALFEKWGARAKKTCWA